MSISQSIVSELTRTWINDRNYGNGITNQYFLYILPFLENVLCVFNRPELDIKYIFIDEW